MTHFTNHKLPTISLSEHKPEPKLKDDFPQWSLLWLLIKTSKSKSEEGLMRVEAIKISIWAEAIQVEQRAIKPFIPQHSTFNTQWRMFSFCLLTIRVAQRHWIVNDSWRYSIKKLPSNLEVYFIGSEICDLSIQAVAFSASTQSFKASLYRFIASSSSNELTAARNE